MSEYTGVWKLPKEEEQKLFHRMKDFANPIYQRGYHLACNPKDEGLIKDLVEWLKEEETWPHDGVPMVFPRDEVPQYTLMGIKAEEMRVLSLAQIMNSNKGFARFNGGGLLLPRKGLHNPWRRN